MQRLVAESRQPPPVHAVVPVHAGWKAPPHAAQVPALHTTLVPPQVVPPQQGWPTPPHPAHWPLGKQRSPRPQVLPVARHRSVPFASQHPVEHALPAQHGCPAPPHAVQVVLPSHTVPPPHTSPAQHGWPGPPQAAHAPPEQVVPAALQSPLPQQG